MNEADMFGRFSTIMGLFAAQEQMLVQFLEKQFVPEFFSRNKYSLGDLEWPLRAYYPCITSTFYNEIQQASGTVDDLSQRGFNLDVGYVEMN